jgi:dihydrodipicolinate synthase/N-acetylneuraminate lyase
MPRRPAHQRKTDAAAQRPVLEANPIPVKWALVEMGLMHEGIRLPLTWLSEAVTKKSVLPCASPASWFN